MVAFYLALLTVVSYRIFGRVGAIRHNSKYSNKKNYQTRVKKQYEKERLIQVE